MTLTETRPETAAEIQLVPPPQPEPGGFAAYLGTGDHKKLGRLFIGVALLWLVASVIGGLVVGFEQVDQGGFDVFESDTYFQASTLVAQGLVFLGLLPLLLGIAIYVVPLQVGSRSIAFPRAVAASFWGYVVGGGMVVGAYLGNGGPGGGEEQAVDLWILSFAILVTSLLVGAMAVATTVVTLRTPGMYLDRVPIFSWSMLVSSTLWIVTLPVLLAALFFGYLDHHYGRVGLGGNYDLYPWYHWAIRQPQVFLYSIPALGIIAEVIAVMAGARQRLYKTTMALVAAAGVLAFGAYTMGLWAGLVEAVPVLDISTSDWPAYSNWVFAGALLTLPLPILLLLGGCADTVIRGRDRQLGAPLVLALVSGLLLLTGASAAALAVFEPLDLLPTSWSAGVAAMAVGAGVLGGLAGLQYWSVKIWGKQIANGAGMLVALLGLGGVLLLGGGQMLAGVYDQPDLITVAANGASGAFTGELDVRDAVDTGNLISVLGWAALAAALLVFGLALVGAAVRPAGDDGAPDDPWNGHTLEWATASPPPAGNFDAIALVTSEAPLLDARPQAEEEA
jgi:cytochrome o ubiquinol oxidase subunit 1